MGMRIFSETSSDVLSRVFQPTESNLKSTTFQPSETSLKSTIFQPSQASLKSTIFQPSQASLKSTIFQPSEASLKSTIFQPSEASLKATIFQTTPASLQTQNTLQDRNTQDQTESVASFTSGTLTNGTRRNSLTLSDFSITVRNNNANNDAIAKLQLSADGSNWEDDTAGQKTVGTTDQFTFIPQKFIKYARVQYAASTGGNTVDLSIFFQGQV